MKLMKKMNLLALKRRMKEIKKAVEDCEVVVDERILNEKRISFERAVELLKVLSEVEKKVVFVERMLRDENENV